jgi:hypothetical protein
LVRFWWEHGLALFIYALLSVAVTWPLIQNFSTQIVSSGADARHNLWTFWHLHEWFLGREPLLYTSLLYYPEGISLLLHGVGPVIGFFSLPFWPWGAEAAYNGAILVGLTLTGYAMYRLARGLRFQRALALFAGTVLMTSAMTLAGLWGHPEKVFIGALPLTALTLHHALTSLRSKWWAVATALAFLLALLTSGYQFVFAVLMAAYFWVVKGVAAPSGERRTFLERTVLIGFSTLVLVGPLLSAIYTASQHPLLAVAANEQSTNPRFRADAVQFFLPALHSRFFHRFTLLVTESHENIFPTIETAVALPWAGIALCGIAFIRGGIHARRWLLFTGLCLLLTMGPSLAFLGQEQWTEYRLPIILPYAFLTELPGLDFMRVAGRFIKIGYVGFAIASTYGLAALTERFPRFRYGTLFAATALILIQSWPQSWPQESLPAAPAFYQQLAQDGGRYGVLDLPFKASLGMGFDWDYVNTSSLYQMYQMTHRKGIVGGYLSRVYRTHPQAFPFLTSAGPVAPDLLINGRAANQYAGAPRQLEEQGYRYVVLHKGLYPGSLGQLTAREFIQAAFDGQSPVWEDERTLVYEVASTVASPGRQITMGLSDNWLLSSFPRRAVSPAALYVDLPREQEATLRITVGRMHDADSPVAPGLGNRGVLSVQMGTDFSMSVPVQTGVPVELPVTLAAGHNTMTLMLEAGNFQATDYGGDDPAEWSFELHSVELLTPEAEGPPATGSQLEEPRPENIEFPPDILVNGQPQQPNASLTVLHGLGWYDYEGGNVGRWSSAPSELLLYSEQAQQVELTLLPTHLYIPSGTEASVLRLFANEEPAQRLELVAEQRVSAEVNLRRGWNRVTFALEAGAFRPSFLPSRGDSRLLSFSLLHINVTTR